MNIHLLITDFYVVQVFSICTSMFSLLSRRGLLWLSANHFWFQLKNTRQRTSAIENRPIFKCVQKEFHKISTSLLY